MKIIPLGGGVDEIGGNKFVFEHKGAKILLDIGMSFGQVGKYYDEFLKPREGLGLIDFFELGLLPDIKGLYREDFLNHMGRKKEKREFDAVFISHAHADHASYLEFIRPDIPIICTNATKIILQALEETGTSEGFINVIEKFAFYKNNRGDLSKVTKRTCEKKPQYLTCREFITDPKTKIKYLELEVVPVDHSLPGASALIIRTKEGNFVYSGDLRFHGSRIEQSENFVKLAKEAKPKLMMCEGTRVDESKSETEEDVRKKANALVSKAKQLVIASIPVRDIDRLATFLQVAKDNKRFLTINTKQAYLLDLMEQNNIDAPRSSDSNIKIYIPRKGWGLICEGNCTQKMKESEYGLWERPLLNHKNAVTYEAVKKNQSKYIFQLNPYEISQLIDVQPKKGSIYIRSTCSPFDEKMELAEERLTSWLSHFNLGKINQIHVSGHASQVDLKKMLGEIKPEVLIPIHTEHKELFKKLVDKGTRVKYL